MSYFEKTPQKQSSEERMHDSIKDVFSRHAFDLVIEQYDNGDYEDSFEDPCIVSISGFLNLRKPGSTGVIELESIVQKDGEDITVTVIKMKNIGSMSRVTTKKYQYRSQGIALKEAQPRFINDQEMDSLMHLIITADYS